MQLTITNDANQAWDSLSRAFSGDPAICNWALSAISRNRALDDDGRFRYWLVEHDAAVSALAMYSAGGGRLDLTPMAATETTALADIVFQDVEALGGVLGHAATAATFAGRWTDVAAVGARPTDGGRVLEVRELAAPSSTPDGRVRLATLADLDLLVAWNAGFAADTDGAPPPDPVGLLSGHIRERSTWIWEHADEPLAMTVRTASAMGTRRIAHVYTPPEQRGRGIAAALVAQLAAETLAAGERCMLHTQLSNPSSNRIYRRLGFEAISESTFYEFID